jgi:hypothetical protein
MEHQDDKHGQSISWHVLTHEHREHSTDWYWGLGLGAVAAAGISLFFGNMLFALIIVIGMGSIAVLAARGPREHGVRIDSRGISLDGTLYRFSSIQSFWIQPEDASREARMLVTTNGVFSPQLVIPLGHMTRAQNVRAFMRRYAQEVEQEAHLGEHLAEIFGL